MRFHEDGQELEDMVQGKMWCKRELRKRSSFRNRHREREVAKYSPTTQAYVHRHLNVSLYISQQNVGHVIPKSEHVLLPQN